MRLHSLLLPFLLLALAPFTSADAQTTATQPATRPAIEQLDLSPAKALDVLEIPADKKTQVLKIIDKRNKDLREWTQQNSPQLKIYRDDYIKAKAAGDTEEMKSIAKLMDDLNIEQTAFYTEARKQITDLLTPEIASDYFTLIAVPPPPVDRSRIRSVIMDPQPPVFNVELLASVRDTLIDMTREPARLDTYFNQQQAAIEDGIRKILSFFPDSAQIHLLNPADGKPNVSVFDRMTTLDLTRDQVAAIVRAVTAMRHALTPPPESPESPEASKPTDAQKADAIEKALRQSLAMLTDDQKHFLYMRTAKGVNFNSQPPDRQSSKNTASNPPQVTPPPSSR